MLTLGSLDRVGREYTVRGGSRTRPPPPTLTPVSSSSGGFASASAGGDADAIPSFCCANLTEQQHEDLVYDLRDKEMGNSEGSDLHDQVMAQFYYHGIADKGAARQMHVLDCAAYFASLDANDIIVRCARPRLSDAVATVLYGAPPKCLDAFLNADVKIFEWRRSRMLIRRGGNEVIVGTFGNFGTKYV
jgi:hypothetical protein